MIRTYSELIKFNTYEERFLYLNLAGTVGEIGFGFDRYLNQQFYIAAKWKKARDLVIDRDNACDLAMFDFEIFSSIVIHHMNPVTKEQLENDDICLYDPEFLICCTARTHRAIHYGNESLLPVKPITRQKNDMAPWLK